jgi:hypothetical protein
MMSEDANSSALSADKMSVVDNTHAAQAMKNVADKNVNRMLNFGVVAVCVPPANTSMPHSCTHPLEIDGAALLWWTMRHAILLAKQ